MPKPHLTTNDKLQAVAVAFVQNKSLDAATQKELPHKIYTVVQDFEHLLYIF